MGLRFRPLPLWSSWKILSQNNLDKGLSWTKGYQLWIPLCLYSWAQQLNVVSEQLRKIAWKLLLINLKRVDDTGWADAPLWFHLLDDKFPDDLRSHLPDDMLPDYRLWSKPPVPIAPEVHYLSKSHLELCNTCAIIRQLRCDNRNQNVRSPGMCSVILWLLRAASF